jgi:uncharacterized protein (TIGR02145 family)
MKLALLLCIPALSIAGNYSGTVTDLASTGLAGVTISSTGFTTTTDAQGHWALGSTTGISAQAGQTHSVTPHLVTENGHIGLAWNGASIQGRMSGVRMGGASSAMPGTARRAVSVDTIVVQWKGKHLFRLPVTGDSSGIAFSIDTAWRDDGGVAWNPKISYGSVSDLAGQSYRTVKIGSQTWMAENLNFAGASGSTGVCYNNSVDSCKKYGHIYTWSEAMGIDPTYNYKMWGRSDVNHQGICPIAWHIPSFEDWMTMQKIADSTNVAGTKLKSSSGWYDAGDGTDDYGFRALPGGVVWDGSSKAAGDKSVWWSATEIDSKSVWELGTTYDGIYMYQLYSNNSKADGSSLRCTKD